MTAAGFAAMGQALAESIMDSTVLVQRNGPLGAPNPTTGVVTPSTQTTIYSGPGRVKPYSRITGSGVTAGEAHDSQSLYTVSVPMSVTTVKPGDVAHVTVSADAQLLTTSYRVVAVERSPQITARRLTCELVEARTS